MSRSVSNQLSTTRQNVPHNDEVPHPQALPGTIIAEILAKIDKADNATLASLMQTCKDMAGLIGTDALLSFFHAASIAYVAGDSGKKIDVFCHLVDWIEDVAAQLPVESVHDIWAHLSHMGKIEGLSITECSRMTESCGKLMKTITKSINSECDAMRLAGRLDSPATLHVIVGAANRLASHVDLYMTTMSKEIQKEMKKTNAPLHDPNHV